ncbi:MAG: ABC transporter permease [Candidatus Hodarchaeota archaeon]
MSKKSEYELIEGDFEVVPEKPSVSKSVLKWILRNVKFLLIPGSTVEELSQREFEYEQTVSRRKFIRRFKATLTIVGIVIVFLIVTLAVFPHWISTFTIEQANGVYPGAWAAPSPDHPLGQTIFGRDVLARMIFGARSSLTVALPAIGFSVIVGVFFGVIAAFFGGWVDSVIMRIADVLLAFPGLILALVFVAILGTRIENIMLAWGILGVPFYARLIRGSVLQARELPYIQAARVSGAGNWRIMFRHILPNVIQPIIIAVTFNIGGIVLALAGLSFLGFSDPRMIDWGNEISDARQFLYISPWASMGPGFMILIAVLGFMLLGDGLRDALDPRLKNL